MPAARSQAAKQQQAALNIGTEASKGGGTGSAQQHTGSPQHKAAKKKGTSASPGGGKSSPSPSKRQPPRDRQIPATSETRSQKTKKTKPDTANFASVTSILESAAGKEMESAAGKDESGTAGEKESAAGEDAGEKESAAGEDETDQEDAGKEMESAAGEDAGTSPVTNPRKRTNSKTNLDDTSSDDDSEIAKGKRHSATSGNSYHLFIFN